MKKMIVTLICVVGFASTILAQNAPQTEEQKLAFRAKNLEQISTASKMIGLDEKQTGKVKTTIENLYKKQDEINNDASLTPDAKKLKLKEANGEKDWKMQNIMGDKYKEFAEARKKINAEAAAAKQQ